jgi:hypothetical protein
VPQSVLNKATSKLIMQRPKLQILLVRLPSSFSRGRADKQYSTGGYIHNAGVQWNIVDITSALCVTSLPALNVLLPKTFAGEWPTRMFQRLTGLYSRVSSPASSQKNLNQEGSSTEHIHNGFEKDAANQAVKEKTSDSSLPSFNNSIPIQIPTGTAHSEFSRV